MYDDKILLEVAQERSSILRQIDGDFDKLKINIGDVDAKNKLVQHIKEFTGIEKVVVFVKKSTADSWIIPIYKNTFVLDMGKLIKQKKEPEANLQVADADLSKYIDSVYICFGKKIIDKCSSRQMTAILLHELGHAYAHSGNYAHYIWWLSDKVRAASNFVLDWFHLPGAIFLIGSLMIVSRTLTFFEHAGEYKADNYAVKYGYGDELAKVLFKFHLEIEASKKKHNESLLYKMIASMANLVFTRQHPEDKTRICALMNNIFTKYKDIYKIDDKELTIIFSSLKCK
jgi:hypothetical protein